MHPLLAFDVVVVLIVLGAAMTCLLFYIPVSWPHPSPLSHSASARIPAGDSYSNVPISIPHSHSYVRMSYSTEPKWQPNLITPVVDVSMVASADKAMLSEVPQQLTVSLGEVLEVRGAPLQAREAWALLWLLSRKISARSSRCTPSPQLPLQQTVPSSGEVPDILHQVLLTKSGQVYFITKDISDYTQSIRNFAATLLTVLPVEDREPDSSIVTEILRNWTSTNGLNREDVEQTLEHWSQQQLKPNPAHIMAACYAEVLGSNAQVKLLFSSKKRISEISERAATESDDCLEGGYLTEDSAISSGLSHHASLNSLDVLPSALPSAFSSVGGRGGGSLSNSSSLPSLSPSTAPTATSNSTDYAYSVVTVLQIPASSTAHLPNLDNLAANNRKNSKSKISLSCAPQTCVSKGTSITFAETSDEKLPKELVSNHLYQPQYVSKCSAVREEIIKRRHPVQRAPSRLYKLLGNAMNSSLSWSQHLKKKCEVIAASTASTTTSPPTPLRPKLEKNSDSATEINSSCTGPEFVVKSALPAHQIQLAGKKKGRVLIVALDGRRIEMECNLSRVTVGEILKVATLHLRLQDASYYGLACLKHGQFVFTPSKFKAIKMAPSLWKGNRNRGLPTDTFTVYLRFKCYFRDLDALKPTTRHWLYLQLRRDVLENRLPLKHDDCIHLATLALQAEFGDFAEQVHGKGQYFVLNHYVPAWLWTSQRNSGDFAGHRNHGAAEDWARQTLESRHRSHQGVGISRSQAERLFLMYLIQCPTYGQYSFDVVEDDSVTTTPMTLAFSLKGLELTDATKPVATQAPIKPDLRLPKHKSFVPWKHIAKISHTRHDLIITLCHSAAKHRFCVGAARMLEVYELISAHASVARHQCNYLSSSTCPAPTLACLASPATPIPNNTPIPESREEPTNCAPIDILQQHDENQDMALSRPSQTPTVTVNKIKIFVPFSDLGPPNSLDQPERLSPENMEEDEEVHIRKRNLSSSRAVQLEANPDLMKTTNVIIIDSDENPLNIQHVRGSSDSLLVMASPNYVQTDDLNPRNESAAIKACSNAIDPKVACRRTQSYSLSATTSPTKKNAVVRMGTRISAAALNRQRLRSMENIYASLNTSFSLHQDNFPMRSDSGAYVIDTSVRSMDETVFCDASESISRSLAERFERLAQISPTHPSNVRVRLDKDAKGALGILVARGASGGVFLMGLTPGGPAALQGTLQPDSAQDKRGMPHY